MATIFTKAYTRVLDFLCYNPVYDLAWIPSPFNEDSDVVQLADAYFSDFEEDTHSLQNFISFLAEVAPILLVFICLLVGVVRMLFFGYRGYSTILR